ncbi:MAG TPA: DUF1598 domain-containing protein, partial [Pirellulales bacterium]|nr:DUF1598 domain-containing protein [Pirellulales bacterium]
MPPRLFELRLQLIPVLCAVIFGTLDAPLGVRSSSAADVAAGPSSTADTAKKAEDLKALLAIANQLRNDLNDERNKLAGADKIVSQKGQVATPSSPEPPPLPSPAASVSAVVLSPAVQARVNEQFNNASQTLDFAQQALDRATKATDPTVMLVDLRDTMDKIRQARQFNERMRSVIDPPPVAVESVAPQTVSGTEVIIPSHEPLTYGSSTALAEAQQINLAQGADVRSQVFENWLRPVEPVKLDPATSVLTMDKGQTLTVEPLTTTLEQLPDTGIGTNFFQTVTTSEGAAVRFDPAVVQVVNDPQHQQELEQIGGVKLQVTLDLLSYYGVPEFRRRGPVTVVKAPVLVSLRNLLEQARSFADSSEHWQQLPTDLRYPGSIERVHGFVLDDQRSDVVLVGSPAASEQTRIDIDCLVVGLRAAWRDGTVPTVSLDPVHGRPAGPQYSRVENVPFDSVFARIMLEADYAMKRITFGELDVGVAGFGEINWTMALQRDLTASRFWLSPMPLGPGDLHVSPTYRTLLFESRVRCLTEAKTCAGQWSGQASANADQTAQLFTDVYPQLEASSLVEPAGIYRRMHGLVDLVTAGKILRDMRINYGTIREFVNLPVRVLSGEETTPRSYPGLDVAVGPPGINYRFRGGAMLESRLGRRSLDMYQDVTTMTLEQASNAFRTESKIAQQLDFSFCLPQSNDVSGSRIDLLMMKGWRAGGAEDYQTARDCFEAVTREDPFYAAAWSYLASAEAMLGHHDQAKAAMAEAVHLEPDDLSL